MTTCGPLEFTAVTFRLALGALLLVSGLLKLRDSSDTRAVFEALGMGLLAGPAVGALIVLELALGAQLLSGWQATVTLASTTAVFLAFTAALVVLRLEDYAGGCSCFGGYGGSAPIGRLEITRNVILGSAAGFAAVVSLRSSCVGHPPTEVPVAGYATAGFLLLVGASAYVLVNQARDLSMVSETFPEDAASEQ